MASLDRLARGRPRLALPLRPVWLLVAFASLLLGTARSQDMPAVEGEAPPGQEAFKHTRGGAFFIDASLRQQYEGLLSRVRTLQADLDAERIDGAEALGDLKELQAKLQQLRDEIEKKKVFVSPGKSHKQSQTTTFDLGPARLLFIEADNVRVEGWDGPQVKCVLEKTVIAPEGQPVDEHLQAIKLVHRHGLAPERVGKTPAESEARLQEILASAEGQKLNDEQRELRRQGVRRIADSYNLYRAFQGKEIDTLQIEGLTYEQGNRQIPFKIRSGGIVRVVGSEWQRYASLTVYVPACQAVAVRGCAENLDVRGVHADLVVKGQGDYGHDNKFRVRDLHGSLTVHNVPIELVESIRGNVNILSTITSGPTYAGSRNGERILATPAPRALTCRNVDGDLIARVTRDELNLETIAGRIDVNNESGKTTLRVGRALAQAPHRLVSESGRIDVVLAPGSLGPLPLHALTSSGTVRSNAPDDILEETSYCMFEDHAGIRRGWRGFASMRDGKHASATGEYERVRSAVQGTDPSPGLSLISRSGTVRVLYEP